jgi:hypothetical protein
MAQCRLLANPSYYDLEGTDSDSLNAFLSVLVEDTLADLEVGFCDLINLLTLCPCQRLSVTHTFCCCFDTCCVQMHFPYMRWSHRSQHTHAGPECCCIGRRVRGDGGGGGGVAHPCWPHCLDLLLAGVARVTVPTPSRCSLI